VCSRFDYPLQRGGDETMKKLLMIGLVLLVAAGMSVTAVSAAPKGIDVTGEHYELNLLFKKDTWNPNWDASSTDRHTIFLPESTTPDEPITYEGYTCDENGENCELTTITLNGVQLTMSAGDEWAVEDANCFDGFCSLVLPEGSYKVYTVARGKPGGETGIDAWLWYYYDDPETDLDGNYYFELGTAKVNKKTEWDDITGLFTVYAKHDKYDIISEGSSMWVFDYLQGIYDAYGADGGYFWDIYNNGNKLVKVRFYPVE
jgi:hypothetical protein